KNHEMRTYTISTSFRLCAVCDAVKTADNRQKNPPVSGGRQSQFPDDDSYFEVLLCPLNLPQEHRKNNSDDGTGCVFVGPRTRHQTNTIWSGLRPDTPPTSHTARLKSVSVRRSLTRQTENRGVPRLRRGFRFCD
ncbi:TPA: hypothetical protein ACHK4D_005277, partial [Escherichia coli]